MSEDLLADAFARLATGPGHYSTWLHYKGGKYVVLGCCVRECDFVPCVVYRGVSDGRVWCRPLAEWRQPVACEGGGTVTRFTPLTARDAR